MTSNESIPTRSTTILHTDVVFERKCIYFTGQSFTRCTFRECTLIIKDLSALGKFTDCQIDDCVWNLNVNISDGEVWEQFVKNIAPAIQSTLPKPVK